MNNRAPTNEDLMLYADGELDAERQEQVESYLDQSEHACDVVATIFELGHEIRASADDKAERAGSDHIADWVMDQIEQRIDQDRSYNVVQMPSPRRQSHGQAPAGSILPVALGGLAVAVAIALVVWRFAGLELTLSTGPQPEVAASKPSPNPDMVVVSAGVPAPDYDPVPTVSVDSIDFGARTGTIFYVPGDTGTTTVVWLSDDEVGDN